MSRTVRLATAASAELDEAARWYDSRRRGLGDEFLAAVEKVLAYRVPLRSADRAFAADTGVEL